MNRAQRVIAFVEQQPNVWIDAIRFEPIGGRQAWRTAISEARQIIEARGGKLENNTETVKRNGLVWTLSRYRYVPADAPKVPAQAHNLNEWSLR